MNVGTDDDAPSHDLYRGAAMILAALARMPAGGDQMARALLAQFGMVIEDFEAAGVDEIDLVELRRALRARVPQDG
jgi:hypothetical protein